jgi:hypothetical protein
MKTNLAGNNASGPVAIAGNAPNGSAKAGAGWARCDANGDVLGVSFGSANPEASFSQLKRVDSASAVSTFF